MITAMDDATMDRQMDMDRDSRRAARLGLRMTQAERDAIDRLAAVISEEVGFRLTPGQAVKAAVREALERRQVAEC